MAVDRFICLLQIPMTWPSSHGLRVPWYRGSGPPSVPCQVAVSAWRILKPAVLLEGGNDHFTQCCYKFMPLTIGRPVPNGQVRGWKIFSSDFLWGTSEASMWLMQGLLMEYTNRRFLNPSSAGHATR
ncbi:hypothetical protein COCVIDRAFT_41168 [Bipolaris victoriae FI3]|uniref:Uncharacterized protein n=1 Tax=Bipolaris victoriae (strain FI3) TaxID=930091 RepID=W7EAZ2_BIPV3|nr:hypothetical protein COCVIDRAFT_41168 [Bipolaris victoriae FI3]